MMLNRWIASACLIVALVWGSTAQAQQLYSLEPGSGGQIQIGGGLPLPVGPAGIFGGGKVPGEAALFPPLLVQPRHLVIKETVGGALQFPPGVLSRMAPGVPNPIAVFSQNVAVFQVATSIDYRWPAANATFARNGGPGDGTRLTIGGAGKAIYNAGPNQFGGAAQFAIAPGVNAGTGRLGPSAAGIKPIASVWLNFTRMAPASVMTVAIVGASAPGGLAQAGAPIAAPGATTMFPRPPNGFGRVNQVTTGTAMNPINVVGPNGTIMGSEFPLGLVPVRTPGGGFVNLPGLTNMVTISKGFPWTTGTITLSQPGALNGREIFYLKGKDTRVAGEGNISLVSGALSLRRISGRNANRGWLSLTLPEPSWALGSMGALAMLGACHGVVRRRLS